MAAEIQKADPEKRRNLILACVIAWVAGGVLIVVYDMLLSWAARDAGVEIQRLNVVIGSLLLLAIPVIAVSRTIWMAGRDVIRTQRYPPPGMKVIRDTVVVTGVKARRYGSLMQALSILFVVLSFAVPAVLWFLVWKITNAA